MKDIKQEAQQHIETTANQIAADEAVLNIDPRFAAAHYGHDLYPTNEKADQSGADERAKFEAYAKEIGLIYDAHGVRTESTVLQLCQDTWNAALASTQPAPQAAQEPVAWMVRHEESKTDEYAIHGIYPSWLEGMGQFIVTPLYATPQPSPAPAVQSGELSLMLDEMQSDAKQFLGGEFKTGFIDAINNLRKRLEREPSPAPAVAGEAIRDAVNEALENAAKLIDDDAEEAIAADCDNGIVGALIVSANTIRELKTAAPSQGAKQ